ncbi:hemerythrin family protein [Treponema primitia ZAS-2]|uniref:Hemerythrin family protein n=1 Tax=Treponema primitia (strain ATCC BAA-887 / DSM 12427 / ZAS-2) TaxID=545694 RepID=F5YM12_TREPZ|nr:bacteriohemerythrin [Treponema primitia]AEF84340.1 hemerythrin family protein [Treponema primitia ZAS-2]
MESEDLVKWEDRYSVGIQLMDDQHKELIRLTNELYKSCLASDEAARAYFTTTIKATVDYVKYHFAAEEKLLENIKYPDIGNHKKWHESFVKQVLEDAQNFEDGKKFVPNTFVRFLKDWILSHIAVEDQNYALYIQNLKKQGVLAETIGM